MQAHSNLSEHPSHSSRVKKETYRGRRCRFHFAASFKNWRWCWWLVVSVTCVSSWSTVSGVTARVVMTCFQLLLEAVRVSWFKKENRLTFMLCGLPASVVCPFVLCPDKQREQRGTGTTQRARTREVPSARRIGHATECTRMHDFDDFSSMSLLICSSPPQLSNISSMSSVVAMTRNKWWRLCGVGSAPGCRQRRWPWSER